VGRQLANGVPEKVDGGQRFAYYALGVQGLVSVIVLVGAFFLIYVPTEPSVNQLAGNLIIFVVGVWLGRGIDYGVAWMRR
jgi:hypothetical protein